MGKKAKFKAIRRMAREMPTIQTGKVVVSTVSGEALLKKGITEVEGRGIDPNAQYRSKEVVPTLVNHNRRMKQLYNKNGVQGVAAYCRAVDEFTTKQVAAKE